jgi:hypothetical protein
MSNASFPSFAMSEIPKCDPELTFLALKSPARLKLVGALAGRGPQIGADLKSFGRGHGPSSGHRIFLDSTLKNLKQMVAAGIVVQLENPQDRRRPLYALTPLAKVTRGADETTVDFGFCFVRFPVDRK